MTHLHLHHTALSLPRDREGDRKGGEWKEESLLTEEEKKVGEQGNRKQREGRVRGRRREWWGGWVNVDVNVNAQTIKAPLRLWLHARIILALMYPVLMHSLRPRWNRGKVRIRRRRGHAALLLSSAQGHRDPNETEGAAGTGLEELEGGFTRRWVKRGSCVPLKAHHGTQRTAVFFVCVKCQSWTLSKTTMCRRAASPQWGPPS